ncbi:MAG TPA: cyclic nucleotide-binding and patatin-like phospholipase domain-containing protein [Terriglobales bacterium]
METSSNKPVRPTSEQILVDLRRLEWAKGLSEETLMAVTNGAEWVAFHADEMVIQVDTEVTHVFFLLSGRLQAAMYDSLGKEIQKDTLARGAILGLFSLGLSERSHVQAMATEPSTAIRLTLSQLLQLTAHHTDFQLAMFRAAANIFKRYVTVDRSLSKPSVVGIVHRTPATRAITARLIRRLQDLRETPCVVGDDERWKPHGDTPFRLLDAATQVSPQEILKGWAANRRLLIDVSDDHPPDAMKRLLSYVDSALWCVGPQDVFSLVPLLETLEKSVPGWRDKIRIVWLLDHTNSTPPYVPGLYELVQPGFKLSFEAPRANQGSLLQHGLERIVHYLRGVRIGLALGGGAARGMAHLGVFRALEQEGIYVDMVAGTSAGAMTGTLYAAGLDPEYLIRVFTTDLRPSWFFRRLPSGSYWYLLYKYRRHKFDSMLRKYLGALRMEQLTLPMFTVGVDLVEGAPLVRGSGDATTAILESINLPPLALPIIESDQMLVDGGLLNNIPADLLVAKGCNFVIASSVTAHLEKSFGISKRRTLHGRAASSIKVIMRQNMIQHHSMNAVGVRPADFVIAPNVSSFDMSEFTRAEEMARIGEATTAAGIGDLHKMLHRLDAELFPESMERITHDHSTYVHPPAA